MSTRKTNRITNLLTSIGQWTGELVYGVAVTATLALYFAIFRHGDLTTFPLMLKLAMGSAVWFMIGYSVTRKLIPDVSFIHRPQNLLLPGVEGVLAVCFMSLMIALLGELTDPYMNFAWDALKMLASVALARLTVRRVFRH